MDSIQILSDWSVVDGRRCRYVRIRGTPYRQHDNEGGRLEVVARVPDTAISRFSSYQTHGRNGGVDSYDDRAIFPRSPSPADPGARLDPRFGCYPVSHSNPRFDLSMRQPAPVASNLASNDDEARFTRIRAPTTRPPIQLTTDPPSNEDGNVFPRGGAVMPRPSILSATNLISQTGLPIVVRQFLDIPLQKYSDCYLFLVRNGDRLEIKEDEVLEEARKALVDTRTDYARRCVQQLLLYRAWKEKKASSYSSARIYFKALDDGVSTERQVFVRNFDQVFQHLQSRATPSATPAARVAEAYRDYSPDSADTTRQTLSSFQDRTNRRVDSSEQGIRDPVAATNYDDPRPVPDRSAQRSAQRSGQGSVWGTRPLPSDPRFVIRPSNYFVQGRVLAMIWHEPHGVVGRALATLGSYESSSFKDSDVTVYAHIKRFVVVSARSDRGHSTCISINTYGGQGLKKAGFNQHHYDEHAIIYMSGRAPTVLQNEPLMKKEAIRLQPTSPEQRLNGASRVNFAKVYTVEHNWKVMDIGIIEGSQLKTLLEYYREVQRNQ